MTDRAKYDGLWAAGRPRILAGDLQTDSVPLDGDPRWGLSLVAVPDQLTRETLASAADELRSALRGRHVVYEPDDMHMTITSLEPYRDPITPQTVAHYLTALEECRSLPDPSVVLSGLGGTAAGIFVQGFDEGSLRSLRVLMRAAAASLHGGTPPAPAFLRDTAHITLSVYQTRIPEPEVVNLVDATRTMAYGGLTAEFALVEYRPHDGRMQMNILESLR